MNWGSDAAARAVAALLVLLLAREFWLLLRARATSSKRLARFGDVRLLTPLLGGSVLGWRRLRHVCIALSLSMMALALLRPQKQDGTRLRPRSELDVVLVVDESKSMNARDIAPSRIERVKAEVASFVKLLPGFEAKTLGIHAIFQSHRQMPPVLRALVDFLVEWFARPDSRDA